MPVHPSAQICRNSIDLFTALANQDQDGAPAYGELPSFVGIQCSIQPVATEAVDDQGRVTILTTYNVIFPSNPNCNPRDKLVWVDIDNGKTHTAFCHATQNEAGRGMAWLVTAVERQ